MQIISASIDLTKVDKSILIKDKQGKPKYLNISVIVKDEKDQYGNNVAVAVGQTKEQREAKEKSVFIGNGRIVFTKEPDMIPGNSPEEQEQAARSIPKGKIDMPSLSEEDDLPF